jgi:hypothetical protein
VSTGLDLVGLDGLDEPGLKALTGFDEIISWSGTARPEFRAAVRQFPFTFHHSLPEGNSLHAVDYYLQQVGAPLGSAPRVECLRSDDGFVAIHPFSGSARKNWPLENFIDLAHRLPLPARFCTGSEHPLEGAFQAPDLYQLACWLARARLYIGNDSGISHLAAAVGVPVIVLFGPTDPAIWAPRGNRVRVFHRDPIQSITRSEVLEAAVSLC